MPEKQKTISVSLDAEAQRALGVLMRRGRSQSEAVRFALVEASWAARRAQLQVDAERLANDPHDRAVVAGIREYFGEPDWLR